MSKLRQKRQAVGPTDEAHEEFARDLPENEAQKSYHTVLEQHIQQALEEIERPSAGLMISSFSAGLDIAFGILLMAVVATMTAGNVPEEFGRALVAAAYTIGFVFVIVGRTALFTEQTTSAVLPVLAARASVGQLLRLWSLVLAGNLIGATVAAAMIAWLGPSMRIVDPQALDRIASSLLSHSWPVMLFSAIAAGWLMGLLSWLVVASRETTSQIAVVVLTTFVIGLAGLHHSIAGSVEVLMAVFAGVGPTLADYARFAVWAVLGNAVGGSLFVALLKFGQVRASVLSR